MKLKLNKPPVYLLLTLIIVLGVFFVGRFAHANLIVDAVGWLCATLISMLGKVLVLVMKGLIFIAQYNSFLSSGAVSNGWIIMRDVCNMFFVLILLVIAFATILKIENYSYKKWLPKLILMAILINFSKTICGLLIDFAQVIMLTFVNAFKTIGGGNLVDMLGVSDWEKIDTATKDTSFSDWSALGAYILALIYVIVALVVLVTMMMMLVMRIVMLWIYVVLSPLAYLLAALPGASQYSSKWWSEFTKNLVVGPVLAFFIWLSFVTVQPGATGSSVLGGMATTDTATYGQMATSTTTGGFGTFDLMVKFVISIGMLVAGLKIAQEIGGAAGEIAGKGMNALNKGQAMVAGGVTRAALLGGKKLVTGDNYFARKFSKVAGFDVRPVKIMEGIKASLAKGKKDDEKAIRMRGIRNFEKGGFRSVFGGVGAGADWAEYATTGFLGVKGLRKAALEASGIRPAKRERLRGHSTALSAEIGGLEKEKSQYISVTDKASEDEKINKVKTDEANKDAEIKAIEDKIKGGKFEAGDSTKLATLRAEKKGISGRREEMEASLAGRTVVADDDANYLALNEKIKEKKREKGAVKEKLFKAAPIQALESRLGYRADINESKTKYKDITNADELIQKFEDAKRRKNKFDQIALLEKLSGDANLNEILNDKGYSANAGGLHSFVYNLPNDHGEQRGLTGFKDDELLRIQNDLGESEERVNHWEMAKMAVMNDQGQMVSSVRAKEASEVDASKGETVSGKFVLDAKGKIVFDDRQHVIAAASEIMKLDPQKNVATLNRLAMGGEDGNGVFQISDLGRVLTKILSSSGVIVGQRARLQNNLAINLSLPHIQKELERLKIDASSLAALKERGESKELGSYKPENILNAIKNIK